MSKTHDEVAHAWANQTHESMRGCNVYFEGDTIFSYGAHFPIARIVTVPHSSATSQGIRPPSLRYQAILFTIEDYSVSTSKHKSIVRRAIPDTFDIYEVPRVTATFANRHEFNLNSYRERITAAYGKAARAQKYGKMYLGEAVHLIAKAHGYINAFFEGNVAELRGSIEGLRISDAERQHIIDKAERWEAETEAREAERARKAEERNREAVEEWKAGTRSQMPHGVRKVYLRTDVSMSDKGLNPWFVGRTQKRDVWTSWGARVPLDDARLLYRFTRPLRSIGWSSESGESFDVGGFPLNRVNEHGLVVGCHRITWDEVDRLAQAEGWE
jgi:hypothetical protein